MPNNEMRTKYWDAKNQDNEQITSALTNGEAQTIAPYYLNLLAGQTSFDQEVVTKMYHASLSYICNRRKAPNTSEVIELLVMYGLIQESRASRAMMRRGNSPQQYILTDIGQILAAYAFSL